MGFGGTHPALRPQSVAGRVGALETKDWELGSRVKWAKFRLEGLMLVPPCQKA
jgi:hypothetical protein